MSRTGWVVAGLLLAVAAWPQHEEHHQDGAKTEAAAPASEKCAMMQQKMGDMHGQMMAKHADLQNLVNEMNTATSQAKVDAIARVVTAMADHQANMHQMEMGMMQQMMSHMGEHMAEGMGPAGKQQMMQCPMMAAKQEGGGQEKAEGSETKAN
jgi:molecular chaperone GrpE (heat shock protein)